ncbi:MAG: DUF1178 family protein [Pseudomonadota bacterium]
MIRYRLVCTDAHEFEAWFRDSGAYDTQAAGAAIACPVCGSHEISKAPMAPRVGTRGRQGSVALAPHAAAARHRQQMVELMRTVRRELESRSEYVGPKFAEEARKIHFEETAPRAIHGEATKAEVESLDEDGIEVMALPPLPEDLD